MSIPLLTHKAILFHRQWELDTLTNSTGWRTWLIVQGLFFCDWWLFMEKPSSELESSHLEVISVIITSLSFEFRSGYSETSAVCKCVRVKSRVWSLGLVCVCKCKCSWPGFNTRIHLFGIHISMNKRCEICLCRVNIGPGETLPGRMHSTLYLWMLVEHRGASRLLPGDIGSLSAFCVALNSNMMHKHHMYKEKTNRSD